MTLFRPTRINVALPPMGGKCWVLEEKGIFILEEGPGTLRTTACTHAGSGQIQIFDGLPTKDGNFEGDGVPEWIEENGIRVRNPVYDQRNGRPLFRGNPAVMGSWMLDAGFLHGLTVNAIGGHATTPAQASIVWMPFKRK